MRALVNTLFLILAVAACLAVSSMRPYQHADKGTRITMLVITVSVIFLIAAVAMYPLRKTAKAKKGTRPSSPYAAAGRK